MAQYFSWEGDGAGTYAYIFCWYIFIYTAPSKYCAIALSFFVCVCFKETDSILLPAYIHINMHTYPHINVHICMYTYPHMWVYKLNINKVFHKETDCILSPTYYTRCFRLFTEYSSTYTCSSTFAFSSAYCIVVYIFVYILHTRLHSHARLPTHPRLHTHTRLHTAYQCTYCILVYIRIPVYMHILACILYTRLHAAYASTYCILFYTRILVHMCILVYLLHTRLHTAYSYVSVYFSAYTQSSTYAHSSTYACSPSYVCIFVSNCRSFFAKEPLIIGLFCGKWPIKDKVIYGSSSPCLHTRRTNSCGLITLNPSNFGSSMKQPQPIWKSPETANIQQKQQIIRGFHRFQFQI